MENNYVIIMLDSTAPSFCYYKRGTKQEKISFENLKKAIEYCQENHFFITVIYPEDELEDEIHSSLKTSHISKFFR